MKNIEKKWMLFLIASFVTFFGIGYTLLKETFATTDVNNTTQVIEFVDGCNLDNLLLSEGSINFNPNVMEYTVTVSDFDNLKITPILSKSKQSCKIENTTVDEQNRIVIIVSDLEENSKTYIVNVIEDESSYRYGNR